MTKFKLGQEVTIIKLGRTGTITEILKSAYRISSGSMNMTCSEAEIAPAPAKSGRTGKVTIAGSAGVTQREREKLSELDLHGLTVEQALEKVTERISAAVIANMDMVKIIHGHGTGRIKSELHRYLGELRAISSFRLDEFNPGVTWVYL